MLYRNLYMNEHARLIIRVRRERLRLFRRNRRVAFDERRHDAADGLDTEREGRDVEQQQVLHRLRLVPVKDGRLNRRAVRHRLVRVDRFVEFATLEEILQQLPHFRDARAATCHHHKRSLNLTSVSHLLLPCKQYIILLLFLNNIYQD